MTIIQRSMSQNGMLTLVGALMQGIGSRVHSLRNQTINTNLILCKFILCSQQELICKSAPLGTGEECLLILYDKHAHFFSISTEVCSKIISFWFHNVFRECER